MRKITQREVQDNKSVIIAGFYLGKLIVWGSWIFNFIKFILCDFEAPVKDEIIHGIGLIPYISIITCWM